MTISSKGLYHRCLTDLRVCLLLKVLSMWSAGELQVHGTCSCRLVYNEVVEVRSNYKKSYLWWFRNSTCGYSTRSKRIEKEQVGASPGIFCGEGRGGVVWFSVCETPLDDWTNGISVDVFFTYGEYGFNSMGI